MREMRIQTATCEIERLTEENERLKAELEQAIEDLKNIVACDACEFLRNDPFEEPCVSCSAMSDKHEVSHFVWRGLITE